MNPQNGGERFPTLPPSVSAEMLQGPAGEGGEMEEAGYGGEEDTGLPEPGEATHADEGALAAQDLEGGHQ